MPGLALADRTRSRAMSDSRARMLASIRASLSTNGGMLAAEAAGTTHAPPPFVHPPHADLAEQFAAELARLAGQPHRCANDQAELGEIRAILQQHAATQVIAWDRSEIGLPGL